MRASRYNDNNDSNHHDNRDNDNNDNNHNNDDTSINDNNTSEAYGMEQRNHNRGACVPPEYNNNVMIITLYN